MRDRTDRWTLLLRRLSLMVVVLSATGSVAAEEPLHRRIDALIVKGHPGRTAAGATDAEFLRRVSLDLTGCIPTSEGARAFLDDPSPEKRAQLIDRLLDTPQYARHMAASFDVMFMERRRDKHVTAEEWRQYLLTSLRENKPYNKLAEEILGADGSPERRGAGKFYLDRDGEPNVLTREVGRIFFGKDLQCAQCHDHPLIDDYLQSEYYGIFAFLSRSFVFQPDKKKKALFAEKAEGEANFQSVFTRVSGTTHPRLPGGRPISDPAPDDGERYEVKPAKNVRPIPKYSRRAQLAKLATDGSNRAFNRNIANRLWAHMMGRGLVHPVDLHHADNPPSHPELLDLLADALVSMKFDVKAMLREIALSQAYQRSVEMPDRLEQDAAAAAELLPNLQAALEQATSAEDDAFAVFEESQTQFNDARKSVTALRDASQKASAAAGAAKKAADEAAKALAEVQKKVTATQQAAKALAEAAAKAREAAEKLPDDKPLATVAEQLQANHTRLAGALETLTKTAEQRSAAVQEANRNWNDAQKASQAAQEDLSKAQEHLSAIEREFDSAFEILTGRRQEVRLAEQRAERAETLIDYAKLKSVARASQQAHQEAAAELAAGKESAAQSASKLAGAQSALNAAQQAHDVAVAKLDATRTRLEKQKAALERVADAAAKADEASKQFPDDAVLAEAAEKLNARLEAYAAELAETEAAVSSTETAARRAQEAFVAPKHSVETITAALVSDGKRIETLEAKVQEAQRTVDADEAALQGVYEQLVAQWTSQFAVGTLEALSPEKIALSTLTATGQVAKQRAAVKAELDKKEPPEDQDDPGKVAAREAQVEQATYEKLKGSVARFVKLFGAGAGQPQNDFFATVDQALFLSNAGEFQSWLAPGGANLTDRLMKTEDAAALAEELYLSVLTRRPSEAETASVAVYLADRSPEARGVAIAEMVWALLASTEFRFNY